MNTTELFLSIAAALAAVNPESVSSSSLAPASTFSTVTGRPSVITETVVPVPVSSTSASLSSYSATITSSGAEQSSTTGLPLSWNGTSFTNSSSTLGGSGTGTITIPQSSSTLIPETTLITSTTTAIPVPTGTWDDGHGTLDASQFSILILPGTKSIIVQTVVTNGASVPYYALKCPNANGGFESFLGGTGMAVLPWYLLLHGGNVCSGTFKPGASFDNTWIRYSSLDQINVPTSDKCSSIGESMRCVLPLDPSK